MDSINNQVAFEFAPFIRVYKDGRAERLLVNDIIPPSVDPHTGVSSKDVIIIPETGVSSRLYLPKIADARRKLPILIYFHGGGFCIESPFSPIYHPYLTSLVAEANVVAVSVDYRLAPEHRLPIAYDDSWAVLQWVAAHSKGEGSEAWLKEHADLGQVFLGRDSAGANISHNMAMRAAETGLDGMKLLGVGLFHPYFWGEELVGSAEASDMEERAKLDKFWVVVCPSTSGLDDPLINPAAVPNLSKLGCTRVLVCLAEKDILRDWGRSYYEKLGKSGWGGELEIVETEGEGHVFHLFNPNCEKAVTLMTRFATFLNKDEAPSV